MSSERRQDNTKRKDETLSGFALSLLAVGFCVLFGGWPVLLWLAPVALAPIVWYLPRWRTARPPRVLIALGRTLTLLAGTLWLASVVVNVRLNISGSEAWVFGAGQVEHVRYRGKTPFAGSRDVSIKLDSLTDVPFNMLSSLGGGRSTGCGSRYSSYSEYWGTLAPLICLMAPTWILNRLRKDRISQRLCEHCEYDLTGNVSGRCPECGEKIREQ